MSDKYILKGHEAVSEPDLITWAKSFEISNRRVSETKIGDIRVSTVFLGIDHNFGGHKPLLFETMVFGGKLDQEQDRYSTWDEAIEGHEKMVEKVKEASK